MRGKGGPDVGAGVAGVEQLDEVGLVGGLEGSCDDARGVGGGERGGEVRPSGGLGGAVIQEDGEGSDGGGDAEFKESAGWGGAALDYGVVESCGGCGGGGDEGGGGAVCEDGHAQPPGESGEDVGVGGFGEEDEVGGLGEEDLGEGVGAAGAAMVEVVEADSHGRSCNRGFPCPGKRPHRTSGEAWEVVSQADGVMAGGGCRWDAGWESF